MATSSRRICRRGMTLVELLLALGLIVLVCGLMFAFYHQIMRSREAGRKAVTEGHLARVIANKIAEEIRSCNGTLFAMGPGVTGKDRQITIQTTLLPDKDVLIPRGLTSRQQSAQCDVRTVQYYLGYDDAESHTYPDGSTDARPLGLVRTEVKTPLQQQVNELNEVSEHIDLFAPEIKYLRFRYFDGAEWIERWQIGGAPGGATGGAANALPQAVEVTVGYDEVPPEKEDEISFDNKNLKPAPPEPYSPNTYTVLVWLPQADAFLGSRLIRAQEMLASNPTDESGQASGSSGGSSSAGAAKGGKK